MVLFPKKSTNVRTAPKVAAVRAGLRAARFFSEDAAARWAAHLFVTPNRFSRPDWEQALLRSAEAAMVPLEGGRTVRAWRWGPPPYVLLAHGWEGRGTQLGRFVEPLRRAGYGVVTFDAPAHGDSPGRESGPPIFGEAIFAVARWVAGIHGIVAHSMGALGTSWALRRLGLEVERIVFVAPGFSPDEATAGVARMLELDSAVLDGMRRHVARRVKEPWSTLVADVMHGIDRPLLVIHDEEDKEVPMTAAEHWVRTAARGELERTSGLGHRRILRDPSVIERALTFLGEAPVVRLDPWQRLLRGAFEIGPGL